MSPQTMVSRTARLSLYIEYPRYDRYHIFRLDWHSMIAIPLNQADVPVLAVLLQ